ncbi:MAG: DUF3347 domain-containing protein [Flavobacteriales bacterium]|nr:DUF3347 domain-containing protein [Flavobacteriales bacterium]
MKKQILTLGAAILFTLGSATFIGCGSDNHHDGDHHEHAEGEEHDHSVVSEEKQDNTVIHSGEKVKDLSMIIEAYLQLKNGLADDDEKKAAVAAEKMLVAFSGFDKSSLDESKLSEYSEIEESAIENAEHIAKSEIYHQREHLVILSEDINDLISLVGTSQKLYIDFCPMANDNKGAIWISDVEKISNPYMGAKMPKCGKIQEEIN